MMVRSPVATMIHWVGASVAALLTVQFPKSWPVFVMVLMMAVLASVRLLVEKKKSEEQN